MRLTLRRARLPGREAAIAVQLLGVFVVALLLVTAMITVNVVQEYQNARHAVSGQVVREATTQADALSTYYGAQLGQQFATIAQQPGIREAAPGRCHGGVSALSALAGGAVAIVGTDGREWCRAGDYRPETGSAWFRKALHGGFAFGTGFTSPRTGRPQIGYASRIRPAGGDAVLVIEQDTRGGILDQPSGNAQAWVLEGPTGVVLDAIPAKASVGRRAPAPLHATRRPGTLTATAPGGSRSIFAVRPVKGTTWYVAVGVPVSRALAPARAALQRNLLLGGLLLLVLLGLGVLVYRRIAVPTRRLRNAISTLSGRDVTTDVDRHVPESGPRELAAVARAFNAMVDARVNSEARLASLVRHASDLVFVLDDEGRVTYATPSVASMLGIGVCDVHGRTFDELVHPEDRRRLRERFGRWMRREPRAASYAEFRLQHGEVVRDVEARAQNLVDDPAVRGVVITCHDITDRKRAEQQLEHAAMHDALTGLPNRALAMDRLRHSLARSGRSGATSAVLFIDLDRFKLVNDSSGHRVGDELLVQVAERLAASTRPSDTLARFGGDEFVVVCEHVTGPDDAVRLAQRLLDGMTAPVIAGEQELFVTASIGIALAEPGDDADDVLRDADAAMYRAKESGRAGWALFDDGMRSDVQRRLDVGNRLRHAVNGDGLFLVFQPVVALGGDGRAPVAAGVEALLRWRGEHGVLAPDEFIPVAEETGLIVPIGEWVLREACRQLRRWQSRAGFPGDLHVSVNVSARQLNQPDFTDSVVAALDDSGLDPHLLTIEVTESVLMDDREQGASALASLQSLGVSVSIDDFGTGYSSLGYLERLPIDELKIDRTLVAPVGRRDRAAPIIDSVVDLAHAVGLTVVAEGVEHAAQAELLAAMGCDFAQGYHFARPLEADDAERLLRDGVAGQRSRSISATRNASSIA